jgi:FkbM family methyltransferase
MNGKWNHKVEVRDMKPRSCIRPSLWLFWHPHQGLWNKDLLRSVRQIIPSTTVYRRVARTIKLIDTIMLFVRALGRRVSKVGLRKVFSTTTVPYDIPISYFDLGTHREAQELSWMLDKILPRLSTNYKAYGFDASLEFIERAQAKLAGRKNVTFIHRALCYVVPSDGKVKLYRDERDGLGSSIYRSHFNTYEEVEAIRFSSWLLENNFDIKHSICLLRLNIEGAEYDVIRDLVETGLAKHIDGYYGMWDDLSKIDKKHDEEFRVLLDKHQISPFTFNGRDFKSLLRTRCIEYDIKTCVQDGVRRIQKLRKPAQAF